MIGYTGFHRQGNSQGLIVIIRPWPVLEGRAKHDGQPIAEAPTPREHWTVEALDAALQGAAGFQSQYPGAALERAEIMRGIDEMGVGRYYLRYRTAGAPTEFWGGIAKGKKGTVNLKTGQVTVPIQPQTPH
jgi:hypothetical protein